VTSPDRFRRALAVTRLTRVAVTRWELEMGVCGVAMPVFGPGGDVVAAIELAVRDLSQGLRPTMAALAIASRSLSRELASEARNLPRSHRFGAADSSLSVVVSGN
jgi:DNA-binding IclR family transcriptional regulator